MKILLLADSNSPHTIRWAKAIYQRGHGVSIFSLHLPDPALYSDAPDIHLYSINASRELQTKSETSLSKLVYVTAVREVKKIIKTFSPDIVHAHYASSYGVVGALSGFHPYIISLWGSDIYSFPENSFIHRSIIKFNFARADMILSTSRAMKEQIKRYTKKDASVTPFGVDTHEFYPEKVSGLSEAGYVTIGTIKTLEPLYGIEYLIKAFYMLKKNLPSVLLKLIIVGEGTMRNSLENLVKELKLENDTLFTGYINHTNVREYHNMLDIYVALSLEESFGVAVLEACACGKPVVVSDTGGLTEIVEQGRTGFIVEKKNPEAAAEALEKLVLDPELRAELGRNGRNKVIKEYNWDQCVNKMLNAYNSVLKN